MGKFGSLCLPRLGGTALDKPRGLLPLLYAWPPLAVASQPAQCAGFQPPEGQGWGAKQLRGRLPWGFLGCRNSSSGPQGALAVLGVDCCVLVLGKACGRPASTWGLVCWGCCNKAPQTRDLNKHTLFSQSGS